MKRFLIPTAIVVALVLPAVALANYGGDFSPQVNNDGVDFHIKSHNGKPRKVTQFEWHNVPAACDGTYTFFPDMKVNDKHKFHGSGHPGQAGNSNWPPDPRVTVTIHGTFKNHNKKVVGTLRLQGTGSCTQDTGSLTYIAHKRG